MGRKADEGHAEKLLGRRKESIRPTVSSLKFSADLDADDLSRGNCRQKSEPQEM